MPKGSEERYQEWLDRLEIPIEETATLDTFKDYLRDEFGFEKDTQVMALWGAMDKKLDLADFGIHPLTITYPWGKELRYGVQGMPGLWGWESVQIIVEAESE